ncbi:MAG TPA: monovalent cation/H(+) antiporter subunit G [Parvibaculum sp.]
MMPLLVEAASWLLFGTGGLVLVVGALGMVRLPDFWSRIHAAGMIDTVGAEFMLAGMMLQSGWTLTTLKLVLIGLFLLIAGPTASHAVANAAWSAANKPQGLAVDDSGRFADGENT